VIPGAVVVIYLAVTGRWGVSRRAPWVSGIAFFSRSPTVAHPGRATESRLVRFLHRERAHPALHDADPRSRGAVLFFVPVLLSDAPWSAFFRRSSRSSRCAGCEPARPPPERSISVRGRIVVLFFSASHSKLIPYVLPAVLPLAILGALALADAEQMKREIARSHRMAASAVFGCAFAVVFVAVSLAGSSRGTARADSAASLRRGTDARGDVGRVGDAWIRIDLRRAADVALLTAALLSAGFWALAPHSPSDAAPWTSPRSSSLGFGPRTGCHLSRVLANPPTLLGAPLMLRVPGRAAVRVSHLSPEDRKRRFHRGGIPPVWNLVRPSTCVTDAIAESVRGGRPRPAAS